MIDNIFINKYENENYSVSSLINGLSDHDAQVLSLFNIIVPDDKLILFLFIYLYFTFHGSFGVNPI
jgi:hypothetical protein